MSTSNAFNRRDQFEAKRRTLLQEAGRVFGQRGFGNTSLDEIAQNLNITKAAFYYYFKNKHELLYECYVASFDLADDSFERALQEASTPCARLCSFVRNYTLAGLRDLHQTMTLRDLDVLTPEHQKIIRNRRRGLHQRLLTIIQAGVLDGSIAPIEPRVLMFAIAGSISWVFRAFDAQGDLTAEQVAEQMVAILSRGFAARPPD